MQRVATSVTIVRYARPMNVPPPSTTSTKLMSVGRVIDLADIERRRRMDVSRPRFEPLEMLRIGGPFPRDLLGAEQPGIRPATVR